MLFVQCLYIVSRGWLTAAVEQCHHWCRRRGCRECNCTTPLKFWIGENPGKFHKIGKKSYKIRAKSLRTFTNSLNISANMAPSMLWFEKMTPELTWRAFFWRSLLFDFLRASWENSGKIPSHPKKFTCSYTYCACHHRDASRSISTFLTLAMTYLWTTGNFIFLTHYICISFAVHSPARILLCSVISWQLSFCTVSRMDTQHQQNTAMQAMPVLSVTLAKSSVSLVRSFPHFNTLSN